MVASRDPQIAHLYLAKELGTIALLVAAAHVVGPRLPRPFTAAQPFWAYVLMSYSMLLFVRAAEQGASTPPHAAVMMAWLFTYTCLNYFDLE
jgi:hypothetical protein